MPNISRLFPVYGVPPMNKSILVLAAVVVAFTVGCEPPAQPSVDVSVDPAPATDSNVTGSDSNVTSGAAAPAVETPAPAAEAPAAEAPAAEAPAAEAPAAEAPAAEAPAAEAPAAEAPAKE